MERDEARRVADDKVLLVRRGNEWHMTVGHEGHKISRQLMRNEGQELFDELRDVIYRVIVNKQPGGFNRPRSTVGQHGDIGERFQGRKGA